MKTLIKECVLLISVWVITATLLFGKIWVFPNGVQKTLKWIQFQKSSRE